MPVLAGVIVDLNVWGLNKELTYLVPEALIERVRVGSIVRVPLRNRRVRGWVVSLSEEPEVPEGVVPLATVSGRGPVFDEALLTMARELSRLYVQPLSSFLALFTPLRIGRKAALWSEHPLPEPNSTNTGTLVRLAPGQDAVPLYTAAVEARLRAGRGAIVAVPEVREGSRVLERLAERFPDEAAVVHTGIDPAERSKALWAVAEGRRRLVLGGRGAVFAPAMPLGLIVLHQEHDPSFKHQQAPYYDARVAAGCRASATGADLLLASATPSLNPEYWSDRWRLLEPDRSAERAGWPLVETVEPPRRGLPQRAIACLVEAARTGERSLILLPRVEATASGPGPEELVALVSRMVPAASITRADRPGLGGEPGALREALLGDVVIATEAALTEVERPPVGVVIAMGVDGYLRRPQGRAVEEAFATLWALAGLAAGKARKGHMVIETRMPEHHAVQALVRGDYRFFVRKELEARMQMLAPPYRRLVRLQIASNPPEELMEQLRGLPGTTVLGPMPGVSLAAEVLLKVESLENILDTLGTIVSTAPTRVLVEVDPKDW